MKLYLFLLLLGAYRPVNAQALIITEIFADPTPSRGLPEREYIELFNRSAERIYLDGYSLSYGSTRVAFPGSFIEPGEYVIVCRSPYVQEYAPHGKVIGLSSLSLNNSGNTLKLSAPDGSELHIVSYSSTWYTAGRSEGYSLEMIDTAYPCRGKANWQSTSSAEGGTPGKANHAARANPDLTPPNLLRYDLRKTEIFLFFDEVLESAFAESTARFELLGSNALLIGSAFLDDSREAVVLLLDQPPAGNLGLRIYDTEDCSGNIGPDITVIFESLPDPHPGDIRLSEVLFNPPPGGEDFVELYNTSKQRFNLKNWQFARLNAAGEIAGHTLISSTQLVLPGNSYLAFTKNSSFLRDHYPRTGMVAEVPALPAYNNDAGTVLLLKPDSTEFDRFSYSEKMHASLIRNPKGVSLERVSFQRNDWVSASSDAGFATPGAPNSRAESDAVKWHFSAEPAVFQAGEEVTRLKYQLPEEELYAAITVLDKHGRTVRSLARNHLLGTSGEIAWEGADDTGRLLPPGYYAFIIDVFGAGFNQRFYTKAVIALP